MSNNLTSQAATLSLGNLPNDLLINLEPLSYIILVPIYAHVIYPLIERRGIRFTPIKRISLGFLLSAIAIASAAVIQHFIYTTNPCGTHVNSCVKDYKHSHLPVWIQLPIYVILANGEILASITGVNYAYSQAPENMRGMVTAVYLCTGAGGGLFGQALVPISEDPYLVRNYVVVGGLSLIASIGVWWSNREADRNYGKRTT
jgi:POT family proton-dependent oligopeptide transporter